MIEISGVTRPEIPGVQCEVEDRPPQPWQVSPRLSECRDDELSGEMRSVWAGVEEWGWGVRAVPSLHTPSRAQTHGVPGTQTQDPDRLSSTPSAASLPM